jgi:hypothetical protein
MQASYHLIDHHITITSNTTTTTNSINTTTSVTITTADATAPMCSGYGPNNFSAFKKVLDPDVGLSTY